jgi:hypothetical protein
MATGQHSGLFRAMESMEDKGAEPDWNVSLAKMNI